MGGVILAIYRVSNLKRVHCTILEIGNVENIVSRDLEIWVGNLGVTQSG